MFALTLSQDSQVAIAIGVATLLIGPVIELFVEKLGDPSAKASWRWESRPLIDKSNYVVARLEKWGTRRSELRNATVVERIGFWGKVLQWAFGPRRDDRRVWYSSGVWVLSTDGDALPFLRYKGNPVHDLNMAFEDAAGVPLDGTMAQHAYLPGRLLFWRWTLRMPRPRRLRVIVTTSHGTLRKRPAVDAHRRGRLGQA